MSIYVAGMLRLYTFVISHFSEKARWALDFEGLDYDERRLLPGVHMLIVPRMAPKTTVPVLDHDGHVVQGSSKILDYLSGQLGGRRLHVAADAARARELEELADHAFGLGTQRIFYDALLSDRAAVTDLWSQGGPAWGRTFYKFAYRGVATAVKRMYKIAPDAVSRARERFQEGMRTMDRALTERPYLDGDAPGRTDLTVASLLAPMCRPPEHLVKWPAPPPVLEAFAKPFEGGPTWNHVLRMYREHRRPS